MKRKIFAVMAIAAVAFTSCKKDELDTTELGSATISGNVWADLNLTNSSIEGVSGMQVSVSVWTGDWDQQPVGGYNYDTKVYTTTTDANGDYTLTIPATEDGYSITIEFQDLYTTRTNADGSTSDVKVTRGDINKFIWSGAMIQTQDEADVEVVTSNNYAYGTATVYGTIHMNYDVAFWNGAPASNQKFNTASGQPQQDLVWMYDYYGPYGVMDQTIYTATFDYATGDYSITFPTEAASGTDVYVYWGIMDFVGTRIENNMAGTADSTVSGVWSCGGIYAQGDYFYDGDLYANYDLYFNFSPF